MADYNYSKLIKEAIDSMSKEEKKEVLKKIGVLDENCKVTEKYRKVFSNGGDGGCHSKHGCDDCDWAGPCMRHP